MCHLPQRTHRTVFFCTKSLKLHPESDAPGFGRFNWTSSRETLRSHIPLCFEAGVQPLRHHLSMTLPLLAHGQMLELPLASCDRGAQRRAIPKTKRIGTPLAWRALHADTCVTEHLISSDHSSGMHELRFCCRAFCYHLLSIICCLSFGSVGVCFMGWATGI